MTVPVVDPWSVAADIVDPPANPYLADPVRWSRERLGRRLWSKQREILESVRDHPRTAVHACHASGKSYVASDAAGWWIDSRPLGRARFASSAPSAHQVENILWFEIGVVFEDAERVGKAMPGRLNLTEWYIGRQAVGFGRKPADKDIHSQLQGIHAPKGVLVILDEAGGIPVELWEAANKLMTGPDDRLLAIGNPDYEGSQFSKVCSPGSGWNVIHIDGLETPNFTDEEAPPGAPLISQRFIDTVTADYGVDSPQYVGQVRGRFPKDNKSGVIPWSWASRCRGPLATEKVGHLRVPVEIGIDVAGTEDGGDETVIWPRFGPRAGDGRRVEDGGDVVRLRTEDSELIVDAAIRRVRDLEAVSVKVDFGGMGFGVVGSLRRRLPREVRWPVEVHAVTFGSGARDPEMYLNLRSEMWWNGRLLSKDGAWDLSVVGESAMAQLTEPQWFETRTNRIQVEEKAQVRKRLSRSPDDADALLLAFYVPPPANEATTIASSDERLSGRRSR